MKEVLVWKYCSRTIAKEGYKYYLESTELREDKT